MTTRKARAEETAAQVRAQERWMAERGTTAAGYAEAYAGFGDAQQVREIHAADTARLARLRAEADAAAILAYR